MRAWHVRLCALAWGLSAGTTAGEMQISVMNPSDVSRPSEPVTAGRDVLPAGVQLPVGWGRAVCGAETLLYQADDLDLDGTADEVALTADFEAGETRIFRLMPGGGLPGIQERATDAQNWKRVRGVPASVDDDDQTGSARDRRAYRFDGVGWESSLIGYRLYLDGRNAVDVQGKRQPGLYWKWIGATETDYQEDAPWGMDVLHVGSALGLGGIGMWEGDSVLKPLVLERQRCRIIARGPVRAVVRVDYAGWEAGSGRRADIASVFAIHAGDRVSEHRILGGRGSGGCALVAGMVRHDSGRAVWDPARGLLTTSGRQSRAGDSLVLALAFHPGDVAGRSRDAHNELVILRRVEGGETVRFLLGALWAGERPDAETGRAAAQMTERMVRRMQEPLRVRVEK
ncbi:MAG: DUF4861 family protein [Bacteroidota bacterium]